MRYPGLRKLKPVDFNNPAEYNAYLAGVQAAAEFAGQYNSLTHHPCRLDDCILAKFNQIKGKPRRNRKMSWPSEK